MLTRHIWKFLQVTPGPFPNILGGAWGWGLVLASIGLPFFVQKRCGSYTCQNRTCKWYIHTLAMVRRGQARHIPWKGSAVLRGHFPGNRTPWLELSLDHSTNSLSSWAHRSVTHAVGVCVGVGVGGGGYSLVSFFLEMMSTEIMRYMLVYQPKLLFIECRESCWKLGKIGNQMWL